MTRKIKTLVVVSIALILPLTWAACQATRAGYESPSYEVLYENSPAYEIRRYPDMEVVATKTNDHTGRDGSFMRLFCYIDKRNQGGQKIAMTTPVFMTDGEMQFVIPTKVAAARTPKPNNNEVTLKVVEGGIFVAMRFSDRTLSEEAATKLTNLLKKEQAQTTGEPIFAYYDPPWTPAALRRNEVLLRIKNEPAR